MPVTFICPSCQKHYTAPDALMGKIAKCPGCGTEFQVPTSGARALYEASNYEMYQDAAAADFGDEKPAPVAGEPGTGVCPACGQKVPPGSRICVACGHNVFEPVNRGQDETNRARAGVPRLGIWGGLLAPASLVLAGVASYCFFTGALEATLVLASIAAPLGVSAMAMLLRRQRMFMGSLAALATVAAIILFILSMMGKHASAGNEPAPRPTFSWHGGTHGAVG